MMLTTKLGLQIKAGIVPNKNHQKVGKAGAE